MEMKNAHHHLTAGQQPSGRLFEGMADEEERVQGNGAQHIEMLNTEVQPLTLEEFDASPSSSRSSSYPQSQVSRSNKVKPMPVANKDAFVDVHSLAKEAGHNTKKGATKPFPSSGSVGMPIRSALRRDKSSAASVDGRKVHYRRKDIPRSRSEGAGKGDKAFHSGKDSSGDEDGEGSDDEAEDDGVAEHRRRYVFLFEDKAPRGFIHPEAKLKGIWDWMLIGFVLYNAVFIPLNLAFLPKPPLGLTIFDYLVDIAFTVDIVLNFMTGIEDRWGRIIYNRRRIASAYFKGTHISLALLPLPL